MTDHIADLLIRVKNSVAVQKYELILPFSKMKEVIAGILKREGYFSDVNMVVKGNKKYLKINVSEAKLPVHLKQISRPGQRIYAKCNEIPKPLRGLGLVIISTPQGVISGREAIKKGIGGELICEVW